MPFGDMVKRVVSGMNTAVATGTWTDISIAVPIDITRGLGLLIWGWDVEISTASFLSVDAKVLKLILCKDTVTAERYINDPTVIEKFSFVGETDASPTSRWVHDNVLHRDLYPATPYFNNYIHVGVYQDSGGALGFYTRIWYSVISLSQRELMGLLTNAGVP